MFHSSVHLRWGHGEDVWLLSFSLSRKCIPLMQSRQSRTLSRAAWSAGWLPWWQQPVCGLAVLVSWQSCNRRQSCITDRKYIRGFVLYSSAQGKIMVNSVTSFFGSKCCQLNLNTPNLLSSLWHLVEGPSYLVPPIVWCPQTLVKAEIYVSSSKLLPILALVPFEIFKRTLLVILPGIRDVSQCLQGGTFFFFSPVLDIFARWSWFKYTICCSGKGVQREEEAVTRPCLKHGVPEEQETS